MPAFRAGCRVDLGDAVEVVVQWGVGRTELDEEAGVASGEKGCELDELLRGEEVINTSRWCSAR